MKTIDWETLAARQTLSEEFIRDHKYKLDWGMISSTQILSESFIIEHEEFVDWEEISCFQMLSESFIERYRDKLSMRQILKNQILSVDFIQKHQNYPDFWDYVSWNKHLTEEVLEAFVNKWHWQFIYYYVPLSENFLEAHLPINTGEWDNLSRKQSLSLSFIQKHQEHIHFYKLSLNEHLTEEIIEQFKDQLHWYAIGKHFPLTFEMIQKYITFLDENVIYKNKNIVLTKKQKQMIRDLKRNIF